MGYLNRKQYESVFRRLERASDLLLDGRAYSQAVARRYYMVYHTACFAGRQYGVTVLRNHVKQRRENVDYEHTDLAHVVEVLFTGVIRNGSRVVSVRRSVGSADNAAGGERAFKLFEELRLARVAADYRAGGEDPIDARQARRLFQNADGLIAELRRLI